jgi:hypothetical protein
MRHRAVGLWAGFLLLGATALMGASLLVSGPAAALAPYGPATQPTTITPTTVTTSAPVVSPGSVNPPSLAHPSSPIAFTGAELALLFTVGAVAIGVGGMLVLMTRRRRRSEPAYARGGR